jgi:hypothetical protein
LYDRKPASVRWIVTGLLLLTLLLPLSARAQEGGPEVEVQMAWEGLMRKPGWTELRVLLTNEGSTWEGSLQIHMSSDEITYHQPLHLPAHSRKEYRLAFPVSTATETNLTLESEDGERTRSFTEVIIGVGISEEQRICAVVDRLGTEVPGASEGCDKTVLISDVHELPENPMTWETIDLLLLNGVDTSTLTEAQQQALASWVGMGGQLFVGGGAALPQTLSGLPPALRIANVRRTDRGVSPLTLLPGAQVEILHEEGSAVRGVGRNLGRGRVEVWSTEPFLTVARLAERNGELAPHPATALSLLEESRFSTATFDSYLLSSMPPTVLPSFWLWLILLLLYVVLMGPGTLLLVRRLRRPLLAWLLWPLWIVAGLLVLGLWLGGGLAQTFPLVHEAAVIFSPSPEVPARVLQGTAIYTPRARVLRWSTAEGWPRPLWGAQQPTAYPASLSTREMDVTWLESGAEMEGQRPLGPVLWATEGLTAPPGISSTLVLNPSGLTIEGTLHSDTPLQDVRLLLGGRNQISLTDQLSAQVHLSISRPLSELISPAAYYPYASYPPYSEPLCGLHRPQTTYVSYSVEGTEFTSSEECYLVAHAEETPFPSQQIGGIAHRESCLLVRVPCPQPMPGSMEVPFIPQIEEGSGWLDGDALHVSVPETIVNYMPPVPIIGLRLEQLTLRIKTVHLPTASSTTTTVQLMLWDWQDERWVEYPLPRAGTEIVLAGEELAPLLSPAQHLRVRFVPDFGNYYDLGEIELTVTAAGQIE